MFVGEVLCLIVYGGMVLIARLRTRGYHEISTNIPTDLVESQQASDHLVEVDFGEKPELNGWRHLFFLIPTLCDLTATTLMNIGLLFISASIYQMLRGSVVLFTGVFSTLFLGHKHPTYRWFALLIVFTGVAIVGMSSLFGNKTVATTPSSPIGIALVVLAQAFTATQVLAIQLTHLVCRRRKNYDKVQDSSH